MQPYVMAEDLYQFKLALVLGRGKRLKKILKYYPTEKKFKNASREELAGVINISNPDSKILNKLQKLDTTYDEMVTFLPNPEWSKRPESSRIMGIDTEYLHSSLDSIQYVIVENLKPVTSGFIFTNHKLAPSISIREGINFLREVISGYKPELIVGHNFNSDISILESAYGRDIPELYYYDDTMDLLKWSNLANIIGGAGLTKAIETVFNEKGIGLFSAYNDLSLLIEYGIKDALYPIYLRHYILYNDLPQLNFNLKLDTILKKENRSLLEDNYFRITTEEEI